MTTADWNEMSADAFNQHMREEGIGQKEMADKLGVSDRTLENYVQAKTAPSGLHFLRAIAVIPQFEAKVRWVSALHAEGNPAANREALELVRAAQKFLDARDRGQPGAPPAPAADMAQEERPAVADLFRGAA
ncbi:MAG TPA: helix-turn-helix transcriptional regulator [Rhizomicrobium sp.]|nr:helix-turn-helix transcriptional regulator [Rhizomicrobium sp.]